MYCRYINIVCINNIVLIKKICSKTIFYFALKIVKKYLKRILLVQYFFILKIFKKLKRFIEFISHINKDELILN